MKSLKDSTDAAGSNVVQLEIVDTYNAAWSGPVELALQQSLRYLKGRREVWLARDAASGQLLVAKCFISGKKQQREFKREVDGLVRLAERSIACPKLLCTAADGLGGLWVITEFIEQSIELSALLLRRSTNVSSAEMSQAMRSLIKVLFQHWDSGVYQTDAHLRNFLWAKQSIYTIDAGSIRFTRGTRSASWRVRRMAAMLGKSAESFRSRFLQSAFEVCDELGDFQLLRKLKSARFRTLLAREEAKNLRRLLKKSQRDCSQYQKTRQGQHTLIYQRQLDPELISQLKTAPDHLMDLGHRLKNGNTCTVQQIEWAGQKIVIKRYNPKPFFYRLRHRFHLSRAMRSWANGIALNHLEISTPKPLAIVEEREFGLLKRAYFLMESCEGQSLSEYLASAINNQEDTERVIAQLATIFGRFKDVRAIHGDFKASNILVDESNLCIIDTDGMKFLVNRARFQKDFKSDFDRLLSNWEDASPVRHEIKNRLKEIFE
ncbi:MAG: hypothetical protein EA353_08830 [Puniceicoccaceae bacterium]|nr:MAG: hypothetical protein EA353_08830 [Puniceicoccaceae bacterium]